MKPDSAQDERGYEIGYCRPPVHTRFQPGVSGNPSGRPRGSQNFRTLLDRILKEEIPLLDGDQHRRVSKAEAITRRLVIGALKGDARSQMTLFRLAEISGQFEEKPEPITIIERIIVDPRPPGQSDVPELPANSDANRDER
jgi:hypothetical protein